MSAKKIVLAVALAAVIVAGAGAPAYAAAQPQATPGSAPVDPQQGYYRPFYPRIYVVRRGDTLFSIARRFGTSAARLARVNRLANPGLIFPGQRLRIPAPLFVYRYPRPFYGYNYSYNYSNNYGNVYGMNGRGYMGMGGY